MILIIIIIVRIWPLPRIQNLNILVKVNHVRFNHITTRLNSAKSKKTVLNFYHLQLQKMMDTKEALLLLQRVMDQEATIKATLITQVTWHIQSHQRQKLDPWVHQNKGLNMRNLVHLIGTHSMDMTLQDWLHREILHCKQVLQVKGIQVLVVWISLECLWGIDKILMWCLC